MFAQNGRAATTDLSHWLGPLSPAFAAIAAASDDHHGGGASTLPGPTPESGTDAPVPADASALGMPAPRADAGVAELRALFHTLNNQLGVILTYAELLEAKAPDDGMRTRATQIVTAAIDALETSKKIRGAVVRS